MTLSRRSFLTLPAVSALAQAAGTRKPNIILILADDLGYGDIGCYGSSRNRTPNLDALASGGVRFTDFHSNGAVCSPTRAALMTGRYQQRCGIDDVIFAAGPRDTGLGAGETTFADQLRTAGYKTGMFGKWHLGYLPKFNPDKHGWDEFRGYLSGNVDYFSHVDQAGHADWWHNSKLEPEEGYTTTLITQHGVDFIERNKDGPFCLYLPYESPHAPYQGPHDHALRTAGPAPESTQNESNIHTYAEMIEAMDEGVGRIIAAVKRAGIERDTFIFFFSDNGAVRAGLNTPCRGWKAQLWEGGHREPAIAYWPGVLKPGQTSRETALSMDLFPTFLEVAGVPLPGRKLDGVSLWPHLLHGKPLTERTLFWSYKDQRAVRSGKWKLTLMPNSEPFLADLEADIAESKNLASANSDVVRDLKSALLRWQREWTV